MTDEQYKQTFKEYRTRFTIEQIKDMTNRIQARIKSGEVFEFGPKGDTMKVKFTPQRTTLNLVDAKNGVVLDAWCDGFGHRYSVNTVVTDMLNLVAIWDLTMKQYYIDLGRKMGMDM